MALKKGDFVEIDYSGFLKENGQIFDTTNQRVAEENDVLDQKRTYGPMTICLGEHFLIAGLDDALIGKETGQEYEIDVPADKGFGKKDPKLIQMMPLAVFKKHNIQPVPGLQVTIDDSLCEVRTVSGGRVLVDFNHILAGKDLLYKVTPTKVIEDQAQQVECFLKHMGLEELDIETKDNVVTIKLQADVDQRIKDEFTKKIQEIIPSVKKVDFAVQKSDEKKPPSEEKKGPESK